MSRCLELAQRGSPFTAPNPLVGCVIVYDDKIIGEGYHKKFGSHHAEVEAINSVNDKGLLSKSTLYVNLEPCAHVGKTPPCADLIIAQSIPKVICAISDPNQHVSGAGIERMRTAGIDVLVGPLEEEASELNKAFIHFHSTGRPYILLKWARTSDGFMGRLDQTLSKQISGDVANTYVHQLRAESQAIVVGVNTVNTDNPQLTTRLVKGSNPMRVVFDPNGRISSKSKLLNDGLPTTIFTHLSESGGESVVRLADNTDMIAEFMNWCKTQGYVQALVEGGRETLKRFIDSGVWNEAIEVISPNSWGKGIEAPKLKNAIRSYDLGRDRINQYLNK